MVAGTTGSNEKENLMNVSFFLDMRWWEKTMRRCAGFDRLNRVCALWWALAICIVSLDMEHILNNYMFPNPNYEIFFNMNYMNYV